MADKVITFGKIGNALKSVANDHIVAVTEDLFDETEQKYQKDINSEVRESIKNNSESAQSQIAELQDNVFPITLALSVTSEATPVNANLSYSVKRKGVAFTGDTLSLTKTTSSGTSVLTETPASSGNVQSPITHNFETFKLTVGKEGLTAKSTQLTRYIMYKGSSAEESITDFPALTKSYVEGISNLGGKLTNNDNEYVYFVVPSSLSISKVTHKGFDVTLNAPVTVSDDTGTYKVYRTTNAMMATTWNFTIQ